MRIRPFYISPLLGLLLLAGSPPAKAAEVEVPVQVGLGPMVYRLYGDMGETHYGLKIDAAAIIDAATIKKHRHRIPANLRSAAAKVGEARIGVLWLPDHLIISPSSLNGTGSSAYGASWRPVGLSIPLMNKPRLALQSGLLVSYIHQRSDRIDIPDRVNFLRPGIDFGADLGIPISKRIYLGAGYHHAFYVPQDLSAITGLGIEDGEQSLWHVSRGHVSLKYRFPYRANF